MLILAHRGASKHAPENTRQAFELGFAMLADGVEFDVHLIGDEIFVLHDFHLHRTTDQRGYIFDVPLAQLQQAKTSDGHRLLTLAETLTIIPNDKWCNIEVKSARDIEGWLKCFEHALNTSEKALDKVIVSSFDHHVLHAIKQQKPEVKIGALSACNPLDGAQFATTLNAYSAHFDLNTVTRELVADAHRRKLKALVYTVDEPIDIVRMYEWQVDGIFTNVPDIARRVLLGNRRLN